MEELKNVLKHLSSAGRTAKLAFTCICCAGNDCTLLCCWSKELCHWGILLSLCQDLRNQFINEDHTMHHNTGLFNGLWSDIETSFMRYGHGQSGII